MTKNIERRIDREMKGEKEDTGVVTLRDVNDEQIDRINKYLIDKGYKTRVHRDKKNTYIDYTHLKMFINK